MVSVDYSAWMVQDGALAPNLTKNDYLVTTYRGVHDHIAKGVREFHEI